jgi:tyrosyl-tRNA synthetase
MPSIITDEKNIDELLNRGVEIVYPEKNTLKKLLMSGKRIRLYCGYDPSAPALHIGNAISLNKLSQFQLLGHEVIFLIGDFTGMIGDPTDKKATRKKLTREEVLQNAANYAKQASVYLKFEGDNPAQIKYNSEWSDQISFKDLIEITSNFTVQQMVQRDMFQERIKDEKPIHLHEFLYPVAQGYDSVALDVDLEIGGNDQMFNMMCGRDLMKAMKGKEKFVLTLKLLADESGKKMGKSEGNVVFLDESPENMYGQIMSWPDGVIAAGFELCTNVDMDELRDIQAQLQSDTVNPRDLKMRLALEITKTNHGGKKADIAQDYFIKTIQKKEAPAEARSIELKLERINIIDLLVEANLASSKGEARRLIEQKGVKADGNIVDDIKYEVELTVKGVLIQKGKISFVRVNKPS